MARALAIAAAALLLAFAPAQAAPRSIGDCEKISEADAYNRCLAAFGLRRTAAGFPAKFRRAPIARQLALRRRRAVAAEPDRRGWRRVRPKAAVA